MGMDYEYAGSASYPRFDDEVSQIVTLFGGVESDELKHRHDTENERFFGYWFGYASSAPHDMKKYIFPEGTDPVLVRWFNNIYDDYDADDTLHIYQILKTKYDEVVNISSQIMSELESLAYYGEGWSIH